MSGFDSTISLRQEQHVIVQPMWLVQSCSQTCITHIIMFIPYSVDHWFSGIWWNLIIWKERLRSSFDRKTTWGILLNFVCRLLVQRIKYGPKSCFGEWNVRPLINKQQKETTIQNRDLVEILRSPVAHINHLQQQILCGMLRFFHHFKGYIMVYVPRKVLISFSSVEFHQGCWDDWLGKGFKYMKCDFSSVFVPSFS